MKVFISWSGEKSGAFAEILRQWLPRVIQAVKPYYSPNDVAKGTRWNNEISKELEQAKVGIICLTPDNLDAPWIMFEAGALSKYLDNSRVCPILFGVEPTDIKGPLVQFQASRFEKEEVRRVIKMLNSELADAALGTDVLDAVFEMWWTDLDDKVRKEMSAPSVEPKGPRRSDRDILEEILTLVRMPEQSSTFRDAIDALARQEKQSIYQVRDWQRRFADYGLTGQGIDIVATPTYDQAVKNEKKLQRCIDREGLVGIEVKIISHDFDSDEYTVSFYKGGKEFHRDEIIRVVLEDSYASGRNAPAMGAVLERVKAAVARVSAQGE